MFVNKVFIQTFPMLLLYVITECYQRVLSRVAAPMSPYFPVVLEMETSQG
jgi:hypothetical protein